MLQPHWIDEIFAETSDFKSVLESHPRFTAALESARKALEEAKEYAAKNPGLIGSSPEQQARVALLNSINEN